MNHRNQCFQGREQSYESSAGEGGSKETLAEARRTTKPYPGEEGKKGTEASGVGRQFHADKAACVKVPGGRKLGPQEKLKSCHSAE